MRGGLTPACLLGVLILGGALRFYGLGAQSLWSDELASWHFASRESVGGVIRASLSDVHPPGYYLLLHFTRMLLGDAEWALRLPSAVAGWLCVPAFYLLGRRLYSGREGLIAALLAAVAWAPVYYGQEARSYSVLLLAATLTAYFWYGMFESLRGHGRIPLPGAAGYALAATACAYLHYFGLLLVALEAVALAAAARRSFGTFGKVILLYLPVAAAYLPWLPGMAHQLFEGGGSGNWIDPPTLAAVPDYLLFLFGRSRPLALAATALVCLLPALSRRGPAEKNGNIPPGALLAGWLVIPLLAAFAVSRTSVPVLTERNLIVSLPAAYLLLARSMTVLAAKFPGFAAARTAATTAAMAVVFAGALLGGLIFSAEHYYGPHKEQIRAAAGYAADHGGPDALLLYCALDGRLEYYLDRERLNERLRLGSCAASEYPLVEAKLRRSGYERLIFLDSHMKPEPRLLALLREDLEATRRAGFFGLSVTLYRVRADDSQRAGLAVPAADG